MSQFWVPWQEKRPVHYGFFASLIISIARGIHAVGTPIVSRFPGTLLLGAVVVVCLAVWLHAILFTYVDDVILSVPAAKSPEFLSPATWGLTPGEIAALMETAGGFGVGLFKYLFWPIQFKIVRDLIGLGGLIGLFNLIPVYTIWWERKVAGRIQSRLGPMRVGGWHGWAQS